MSLQVAQAFELQDQVLQKGQEYKKVGIFLPKIPKYGLNIGENHVKDSTRTQHIS